MPSPYFIADGPPELARLNTDAKDLNADLRALCRNASDEMLHVYLDKTTIFNPNLREIIKDEIDRRRFKELKAPNWHDRWIFKVVVIAGIISALDYCHSVVSSSDNRTMQPLSGGNHLSEIARASTLVQAVSTTPPATIRTNSVAIPASPKK
jgi:hypothetical protein